MRKNFTSEQMLHTARQVEGGMAVAEVCRKVRSQNKPSTKWKRRVAGMGIGELARL